MTAQPRPDFEAMDDVSLARLCSSRNRDAMRHLITANNQRLFRAAWSILKDRFEAEEAVQAGYLNAFAAMKGFEGRSHGQLPLRRRRLRRSNREGDGAGRLAAAEKDFPTA